MKILLVRHHDIGNINTRLPESINKVQGIYPPLGIAYIASVLEASDHKVKILDSQALNLTTKETKKEIYKFHPDVVGITCMTSNLKGALEVARLAKDISEDIVTVLGGSNLFVYPRETLTYDYVDFGVAGEGEIIFPELISAISGRKKLGDIDGLAYKKNNVIKFKPATRWVKNLNILPFPARHLLPNHKYFSILSDHPFTTMITSRGCPYNCGYCFRKHLDKIVRFRSPENVVDEIEHCLEMGFKEIWFYDDTFTMNRKHVIGICNEILARGLNFKWEAVTRVDCVDLEILKKMKMAGCHLIRYGIESGDQAILNIMKKGITLKQAEDAISLTKHVGIDTFCFFMIGYPGENEEKIKKTIDFTSKLNPDWVMFSNTIPYPSTELLDLAYELGLLEDKDYWKKFTMGKNNGRIPYRFPGLDKWVEKAYKQFYFRPRTILKTILRIKNLRQAMRYMLGLWALVKFKSFKV
jgi:radical SAM superfamily enzyme YgiQ (UPF0313 family)